MQSESRTPITDEALRSLELFKAIRLKLGATEGLSHHNRAFTIEELRDALGRFKVWIGNLGALSRGRSSLDHRLAQSDIRLEVLRLVRQLRSSLSERRRPKIC